MQRQKDPESVMTLLSFQTSSPLFTFGLAYAIAISSFSYQEANVNPSDKSANFILGMSTNTHKSKFTFQSISSRTWNKLRMLSE